MKVKYTKKVETETEFEVGKKYTITNEVFPLLIDFLSEQTFIASDVWYQFTDFFTDFQTKGGSNHSTVKAITILTNFSASQNKMVVLLDWGKTDDFAYLIFEKKTEE